MIIKAALLSFMLIAFQGAVAETFYVTQSGAGDQDGSLINHAWSIANFNNAANWGASAGEINAGDTVCLSGVITSNTTTLEGSGTAESPIIIDGKCSGVTALDFQWSGSVTGLNTDGFDYINLNNIVVTESDQNALVVSNSTGIVIQSPDITVQSDNAITINNSNGTVEVMGPNCYFESENDWIANSHPGGNDAIELHNGNSADLISVHGCHFRDWGHTAIRLHGDLGTGVIYKNLFDINIGAYGRGFATFPSGGTNNLDYLYVFQNKFSDLRVSSKFFARNTFVYNNYFENTENRCWASTDTGCTYEYYIGGSDAQKYKYNATGYAASIGSDGDSFTISEFVFANNTFNTAAEVCISVSVNPDDHPVSTDAFSFLNNIFLNCGDANQLSDSPPGSESVVIDSHIFFRYDGWPSDSGTIEDNIFYGGESDLLRYPEHSGAFYDLSDINSSSYVPNWTGTGNLDSSPLLNSDGIPSASSPAINGAQTIANIPDPSGFLPSDGQISYALAPSSVWPDAVVTINRPSGAWDIGAFELYSRRGSGVNTGQNTGQNVGVQ